MVNGHKESDPKRRATTSTRAQTVAETATAQAGIAEMAGYDMIPGYGWEAGGVLSDVIMKLKLYMSQKSVFGLMHLFCTFLP